MPSPVGTAAGLSKVEDVARWLVRRNPNPKTLGSIPWLVMVRHRCFCPSESTADLFVPDNPPHTPSCVRHAPKFVRTLKI